MYVHNGLIPFHIDLNTRTKQYRNRNIQISRYNHVDTEKCTKKQSQITAKELKINKLERTFLDILYLIILNIVH